MEQVMTRSGSVGNFRTEALKVKRVRATKEGMRGLGDLMQHPKLHSQLVFAEKT